MLYTIGHSTRSIEELVEMLRAAAIAQLYDVRRYPGSRRNPQFGKDAFERSLVAAGIRYRHAVDLGGRRKPLPNSPNDAWKNEQFRGYADHLNSPEFQRAFAELLASAAAHPTAVMCAEARPERCHRRLIADAAALSGVNVVHLIAPGRSQPHVVNPAARLLEDGRIVYPADASQLALSQT